MNTTPSDIPGARKRLQEAQRQLVAQREILDLAIAHIDMALSMMYRAAPDKVTRVRHAAPTKAQKTLARRLRRETDKSVQDIAVELGLNAGRVSEIVKGLR